MVVRQGTRVLLVRRPSRGRWAGLWEFPHGPLESGEEPEQAVDRLARELVGLHSPRAAEMLTIRHGVTQLSDHAELFRGGAGRRRVPLRFLRRGCLAGAGRPGRISGECPAATAGESITTPGQQRRLF